MKVALLTGTCVLLLLAVPAPTYALGLAEYGPAAGQAVQPVLSLSWLNGIPECMSRWQTGFAICCAEAVPLAFRGFQLLLAGTLLAEYWSGRRVLRQYLVKVRRALQHLKPGGHGHGLLLPR